MVDLGFRSVRGRLNPQNPVFAGGWTVSFTPSDFCVRETGFAIYHMALKGPSGSTFEMWLDDTFYSAALGEINDNDLNQVISVDSGNVLNFHWNTAAGVAPYVTVHLRTLGRPL